MLLTKFYGIKKPSLLHQYKSQGVTNVTVAKFRDADTHDLAAHFRVKFGPFHDLCRVNVVFVNSHLLRSRGLTVNLRCRVGFSFNPWVRRFRSQFIGSRGHSGLNAFER
jgi:hypothetical protein